jgi:hypothetical protein
VPPLALRDRMLRHRESTEPDEGEFLALLRLRMPFRLHIALMFLKCGPRTTSGEGTETFHSKAFSRWPGAEEKNGLVVVPRLAIAWWRRA